MIRNLFENNKKMIRMINNNVRTTFESPSNHHRTNIGRLLSPERSFTAVFKLKDDIQVEESGAEGLLLIKSSCLLSGIGNFKRNKAWQKQAACSWVLARNASIKGKVAWTCRKPEANS